MPIIVSTLISLLILSQYFFSSSFSSFNLKLQVLIKLVGLIEQETSLTNWTNFNLYCPFISFFDPPILLPFIVNVYTPLLHNIFLR